MRVERGGLYRWTLRIERKSQVAPQLQLGIQGLGHLLPWRLVTTSRLSRARDEKLWEDRPDGDREVLEGDYVHFEVDLRGLHFPFGTLTMSLNSDEPEVVFDDIPLSAGATLIPVASMGGDQTRVRLCPAY